MNSAPYEAQVLEPNKDPKVASFSITWKMWLDVISRILTSVQYSTVAEYSTPLTGFSLAASSSTSKMVLTPAGVLATGAVQLPSTPADGAEWRLTSTRTVTALTLNVVAGQTIMNAPTTLVAGAGVCYTYSTSTSTWYRLY